MAELPEVRLAPVPAGVKGSAGTKLGGKPQWIQAEWRPECCNQPMSFLGQIDSLDIPEAELPDSALVYVFFCPECFDVDCHLQCC
jgi:uncharacterized protein YwqG